MRLFSGNCICWFNFWYFRIYCSGRKGWYLLSLWFFINSRYLFIHFPHIWIKVVPNIHLEHMEGHLQASLQPHKEWHNILLGAWDQLWLEMATFSVGSFQGDIDQGIHRQLSQHWHFRLMRLSAITWNIRDC